MVKKADKDQESNKQQQSKNRPQINSANKRKPRGALFHGDDSTLARRVEEELHGFGRWP